MRALVRRARVEREMDDEVRFHIDARTEHYVREGMTLAEARRRARLEFGAVDKAKEASREARGVSFLDSLAQDLRFGARILRKSPGFTAVAVITLALGIGANTAIFSATYSILLRPLAYKNPSQLVVITAIEPGEPPGAEGSELSLSGVDVIRARAHGFGEVIAVESQFYRLTGGAEPEDLETGLVSGNYFDSLGVSPFRGRFIQPGDIQSGAGQVAVLSYPFWQKHFGGDPGIVGKEIDLIDVFNPKAAPVAYEIVGITQPVFNSPGYDWKYDVWLPQTKPLQRDSASLGGDNFAVGRMNPGVSIDQANAELRTLSTEITQQFPWSKGTVLHAQPLKEMVVGRSRLALLVLLGAVGFLLLIACVNVSNLMLARAWGRLREVGIRRALGAGRGRVMRQFLTETLLVSLIGCGFGWFLAFAGVSLLRANAPEHTPRIEEFGLYPEVFWYALGISVLAGIAFGVAPAVQVSGRRLSDVMKGSGSTRFLSGEQRHADRYRNVLIIAEVALSVVLLIGSGLLIRSFASLMSVPLGLRTDHILTMEVGLDRTSCRAGQDRACNETFDEILQRINALPGVKYAAFTSVPPLTGGRITIPVDPEGWPPTPPGKQPPISVLTEVTPGYFSVMGIQMDQGRVFASADAQGSQLVGIVNEAFARKFFSGDALGKRLMHGRDKLKQPVWLTIVGVVKDARDAYLWQKPQPELYQPRDQANDFPTGYLLVRTSMEPESLIPAIDERIWSVSKGAPIDSIMTMDQIVSRSVAEPRFQTFLISAFGALGLLLAIVGIYGVISYAVGQRTQEIGIRIALGAGPSEIMRLVAGNGLLLAAAGIAIGSGVALALTRYLRSLLFEVKPTDPTTFVGVAVLFLFVALAACYLPARRAMRVDPMVALRNE